MVETAVRHCFACQCTYNGNPHIEPMHLVDEYSRYPIVEVIHSVSANTVIPVLDKILAIFGIPEVIK